MADLSIHFFQFSKNYFKLSVTLACGGKSSDNNTYIVQTAVTTLTSPCKYTICPVSSDVCRTRFDFVVSKSKPLVFQTKIIVYNSIRLSLWLRKYKEKLKLPKPHLKLMVSSNLKPVSIYVKKIMLL